MPFRIRPNGVKLLLLISLLASEAGSIAYAREPHQRTNGVFEAQELGISKNRSEVLELSSVPAQASPVQTILTSEWSPPSPDPAGIAYFPPANSLLISDSEVNEMQIFAGVNLWQVTLSGDQVQEFSTTDFSDEPSGIAYNPDNQHLFFTDDSGVWRVYELDPGPDGSYNTADDIVTSFETGLYSSNDPEGITYDTHEGHLFISDGANAEVYEIDPGANGVFDGVPPVGDDVVGHFDTAVLGLTDPEGVEFNPDTGTLYIVSRDEDIVVETTRDGTLVRAIDLSFLDTRSLAGVAYAPSSTNPSMKSLYFVDRGVDNDIDPYENDGKIYEVSLGSLTPSLVIDGVTLPPREFQLEQNYPNPFSQTTEIPYTMLRSGFVTLKIYDPLGRKVQSLVSGFQVEGTHSIDFDASNLSSGVYLYTLQIGNELIETKKMMILN